MEIKIFKTNEIDDDLWEQIVNGFNESFNLSANVNSFKRGFYTANYWGYAFHAVAINDDGDLMAHNAFTPMLYKNSIKAVVSGTTYVRKKYRSNVMLFSSLIKKLRNRCNDEGFDIEIGVPNHNSIDYHCKINKAKMIGDLSYYLLPLNLSNSSGKHFPKIFDIIWSYLIKLLLMFNSLTSLLFENAEKERKYSIDVNEDFWRVRFKNPNYKVCENKEVKFVYLLYKEEGRLVAYLMDFRKKNSKSYSALVAACNYIAKNEKVDAILYVGFMHVKQMLMCKLPKKIVPKRLPLTCYVINKANSKLFDDITDIDNWNFSLMNFDVR